MRPRDAGCTCFFFVARLSPNVVNNVIGGGEDSRQQRSTEAEHFVLKGGPHRTWDELDCQRTFCRSRPRACQRQALRVHQVIFHGFVVHLDRNPDQVLARPFVRPGFQLGHDFALLPSPRQICPTSSQTAILFHGDADRSSPSSSVRHHWILDRCRSLPPVRSLNHLHTVEESAPIFVAL